MTPAPPHRPAPAGGPGTYRDRWGIPHLWAESTDQLAHLQGLNAATDRSWQIELERWRSEGRTAEMLGADGLHWDRFARQARLDDTARRCFEGLDDATRLWCESYVAGINQALTDGLRGGSEFKESGTAPEPWNPWTPLGVFLVQHILFSTFPNKLFRAHVGKTLGPEAVGLFSIEAPVWSGSNAWAVHGSATASGKPLIAGDPHRLLELPGVYQQVRLACPEFDAIGFAFPGVPGLPHFGHTGHTAWAITNAMADYQDLFEEHLRRVPAGAASSGTMQAGIAPGSPAPSGIEARGPLGWEPALVGTETLQVRGGSPVAVEIIETARGPVIAGGPDGGALSLRFPARVEARLGFEALLPLLQSRSVADVEGALAKWVEPVNSVVAADTAGTVRHFLAGLVPERNHANRRTPVPATASEHAWTGIYAALPSSEVTRFAVSANDRDAGGGDALGMEFAPAHRARRIRELLEAHPGPLTADSMQAIHSDTSLGPWPQGRALLETLDAGSLSAEAETLRARLLGWDGRMDAGSTEAAGFATWRGMLVRRIARHPALAPLGAPTGYAPLFGPWLSVASRVGFALETLLVRGPELGISPAIEAAAALEEAALEEAVRDEAARDEAGARDDSWGGRHQLLAVHELPGALANAIPTAPLAGDTGCVLSTESLPGVEDRSFRGPVARYVWDLAHRQESRWVVPFGAAGNPEHPHFADQLPLWAAGELIPVVTDWTQLTPDTPPTPDATPTPETSADPRPPKETMTASTQDFAVRATVHAEELEGWGALRIVPLVPTEDLELIYGWVTQPRARFWGMTEHSRGDVLEIYEFLDSLDTHHAFLVLLDGEPMALFQTYEPLHDPVGEVYPAREEDIGMHLLLAPSTRPVPHFTPRLGASLVRYMFSVPGKDRIIVEPDARNAKALRRLEATCFELGPIVQLAEKEAQLGFLTREGFDRSEPLRSR
ncbi:GNAT family N-acetyltransferase [Pseudarthrobacter sulfonivorans]|uniref:GNAT family N-acetyltransferase n=1 Tax=Pseudarthrobacter sulfonivorans TaxID=121292 RepID=UPI00286A521C|nr:GNAT family N-acetyltransferase [Pseudarthrobacter sulfonivorans]